MVQNDFGLDQEQGEFNLFEYLGLLRRYLKIIVLFGVLGLGIGVIYWFITPPKYRAAVVLKMSHISRDVIGFGQQYVWDPYRDEFYKTEFEIIASLPVSERVVTELGLPFFRKDETASAPEDESLVGLIGQQLQAETELDADAVAKREKEVRRVARNILGGLEVGGIRGTNLVRLSYTSHDPNRSQTLANAWARAYISHDLDVNYEKNLEAYTFLANKSDDLRIKVDRMEKELVNLKQDQDIVTIGRNSTVEEDSLARFNDLIIENQSQLAEKISAVERLENSSPSLSSEVGENPIVKELVSQLSKERSAYEQNLKIYKPQAPRMVASASQISSIERDLNIQRRKVFDRLLADARSEVAAKEAELQRLNKSFDLQKKEASQSKLATASQIMTLESQINVMRKQLEMLDYKKEEVDLALSLKNIGRSNKVIMQDAELPGGPFAPSLKRFGLAGLVVGLFLAAGLIFVLEITDRKIHSVEILERVTSVPNLATIPRVGGPVKDRKDKKTQSADGEDRAKIAFLAHSEPTSPFAENYRHLRTNIQLSKAERNKVLLVTSAVSGDGKTVSSTNLAISFAQLEKKILLVDCDLRRPKMHKLFRTHNQRGVVTMIVDREPLANCVHHTSVPNLDLITAGPLPPNPAELVASPRMAEVLQEWRDAYDYVVIDTSPLLAVADASILAHQVDSLVFVAKASVTIRDDAARALQLLAQNEIRALGSILNSYDFALGRKYGYRYGYRRHGYGYGYGPYEYKAEKA